MIKNVKVKGDYDENHWGQIKVGNLTMPKVTKMMMYALCSRGGGANQTNAS